MAGYDKVLYRGLGEIRSALRKPSLRSSDVSLALHEASHAVAARALGYRVESVECDLRSGEGMVQWEMPTDAKVAALKQIYAVEIIAVTSAPLALDQLTDPGIRSSACWTYEDENHVQQALNRCASHDDARERQILKKAGQAIARNIVEKRFVDISRVGCDLLLFGKVDISTFNRFVTFDSNENFLQ